MGETKMNLLLSNDDSVYAEGLAVLTEHCKAAGFHVQVVAPDRDRSGASNSLTLDRPLHPVTLPNHAISINGTPSDCVHLAINSLCDPMPQRVIAGINSGANLGDDVLYSGTVAAAMEGRFLDKTPLAVSLVGKHYFVTAAKVTLDFLNKIETLDLPERTVININVPDVPYDQLKGIKITRLGHRHQGDNPVQTQNPRGKECYWINSVGHAADTAADTDFYAIEQGYVSVTPIQVDMTAHSACVLLENIGLNDLNVNTKEGRK